MDVLAAVDHRQDRVEDARRGVDLVERRLRKEGGSWGVDRAWERGRA